MKCEQNGCNASADTIVFWPGQTTRQCIAHATAAANVATAMGFALEMRPLDDLDHRNAAAAAELAAFVEKNRKQVEEDDTSPSRIGEPLERRPPLCGQCAQRNGLLHAFSTDVDDRPCELCQALTITRGHFVNGGWVPRIARGRR